MDNFAEGYALPVFAFTITIDGVEFSATEISGLDHEVEKIESRVGNDPVFRKRQQAGITKWPNLVVKHALYEGDGRFNEKWEQLLNKDYYTDLDSRFEVLVELWNERLEVVQSWTFTNCIVVKLGGTALKADGNELYFETLEIAHEGIVVAQ